MTTATNFNYYKLRPNEIDEIDTTGNKLKERPFYQCPVFTTHNTFIIKDKTLLGEKAYSGTELDTLIKELVDHTKKFPVCIEIDTKGRFVKGCNAGHGAQSNDIEITPLCIKIMKTYYEQLESSDTLYPLILHIDVEGNYDPDGGNCLKPADIKTALIKYPAYNKLLPPSKDYNYDKKKLNECMGVVLIREKVIQKALKGSFDLPHITYHSSIEFVKTLKFKFKKQEEGDHTEYEVLNPTKFGAEKHNRMYPGWRNQQKYSGILLQYCIHLFASEAPYINVPTLIGVNYDLLNPTEVELSNHQKKIGNLKQLFTNFYLGIGINIDPYQRRESFVYEFTEETDDVGKSAVEFTDVTENVGYNKQILELEEQISTYLDSIELEKQISAYLKGNTPKKRTLPEIPAQPTPPSITHPTPPPPTRKSRTLPQTRIIRRILPTPPLPAVKKISGMFGGKRKSNRKIKRKFKSRRKFKSKSRRKFKSKSRRKFKSKSRRKFKSKRKRN
jgi:hypothetical protein